MHKTLAAPGTYNITTLIIRDVMKLCSLISCYITIKSFKALHGAYNIIFMQQNRTQNFYFSGLLIQIYWTHGEICEAAVTFAM